MVLKVSDLTQLQVPTGDDPACTFCSSIVVKACRSLPVTPRTTSRPLQQTTTMEQVKFAEAQCVSAGYEQVIPVTEAGSSKRRKLATPSSSTGSSKSQGRDTESPPPPLQEEADHSSHVFPSEQGDMERPDAGLDFKCTACGTMIAVPSVQRHPQLGVGICGDCRLFLVNGQFTKGLDCQWCGKPGVMVLCDAYDNACCFYCITRNFGKQVLEDIVTQDSWRCFSCNSAPLRNLRYDYNELQARLQLLVEANIPDSPNARQWAQRRLN